MHQLIPYTIIDLQSALGGFVVPLFYTSLFIASILGKKRIVFKFIRKLYFINNDDIDEN
jgi:hypothetical protein